MLRGGCHCGEVRYEVAGPTFHETVCHCLDCRRSVGAAAVAWFSANRNTFRFSTAEPARYRSSPGVTRRFCSNCGSSITFERDDLPDELDITTASLDQPEAAPPRDHTRTAGKVGWVRLCDSLPAYPDARP